MKTIATSIIAAASVALAGCSTSSLSVAVDGAAKKPAGAARPDAVVSAGEPVRFVRLVDRSQDEFVIYAALKDDYPVLALMSQFPKARGSELFLSARGLPPLLMQRRVARDERGLPTIINHYAVFRLQQEAGVSRFRLIEYLRIQPRVGLVRDYSTVGKDEAKQYILLSSDEPFIDGRSPVEQQLGEEEVPADEDGKAKPPAKKKEDDGKGSPAPARSGERQVAGR